ncbi:hypothetical protein RO3G_06847 [Rhizopus delemar RA 99-880]|uniref:Velvet domain-containing protein n=1 Tax=Rhizopus delemar (strain RA 99-880 / ATCC MYA-4621 / FGSC 9543 / NRRL 43880) TaxID=246409 RepID=I1C112_RHIO9|nr:hypothetical protein RO3G_06847 [Rhizopus delemar RA 99-880]|eukprot:EIE82142.1 hypothetical protein RO3G_06847 [Rhizopus delemar RA 99-880]
MNNFTTNCTYRFVESSISDISEKVQEPERAKVSLVNERDRRSIEPPPILQLYWENATEEELKKCLQSPFYFMVANLVTDQSPETLLMPTQDYLSGTTVSSLHRLRDLDNSVAKSKIAKLFIPMHSLCIYQSISLVQLKQLSYLEPFLIKVRKRKNTNETDNQLKKQQPKRSDTIISSPPYADPSSNSTDVFFGRWQATTASAEKLRQISISTSPSSVDENDYRSLTNKFRYHHEQPSFPSPESTSTYSSLPPHSYHRNITTEQTSYHKQLPSSHFVPVNQLNSNLKGQPTLPHLSSSIRHSQRLPTPPITDHYANRECHWGTRLPPLRAIMNGDYKSSVSMPLILPPPSSITSGYVIEPYPRH